MHRITRTLLVVSGLLLCSCGDRATDAGADAGTDQGVVASAAPDSGTDLALADLPPAKQAPDTVANTPCVAVVTVFRTYAGGDMVICETTGMQGVDHCSAELLCNTAAGWKACTASQYLKRGGKTDGTQKNAWLKSCVLSSGTPHAPTDAPCALCSAAKGSSVEVVWPCTGPGAVHYLSDYVWGAVVTHDKCVRIGQDSPATEGQWIGWTTTDLLGATVCCR
jgi:hypothetical protein